MLASGNLVFDAAEEEPLSVLKNRIETGLRERFGYDAWIVLLATRLAAVCAGYPLSAATPSVTRTSCSAPTPPCWPSWRPAHPASLRGPPAAGASGCTAWARSCTGSCRAAPARTPLRPGQRGQPLSAVQHHAQPAHLGEGADGGRLVR